MAIPTWARGVLVVVYVLATGPLLITDREAYDGGEVAVAIFLLSLVWLAFVSLVFYCVRRFMLRRPVSYIECFSSVPVMLTCFLLAVLSAAGRTAG